jgi:diguanylate cyclase (GGDEF)-like protein
MDHRFRLPSGREIQLTASIGVVVAVKGERGEALIARADRAMYLAKSRGRNRWVVENGDAVSTRPL